MGAPVPRPPPGVEADLKAEENAAPTHGARAARAPPRESLVRHRVTRSWIPSASRWRTSISSGAGAITMGRAGSTRAGSWSMAHRCRVRRRCARLCFQRKDSFVTSVHREAADLRARSSHRVLRSARDSRHRAGKADRQDDRFSAIRTRHREERAFPVQGQGACEP